jgi:hypothetical protein
MSIPAPGFLSSKGSARLSPLLSFTFGGASKVYSLEHRPRDTLQLTPGLRLTQARMVLSESILGDLRQKEQYLSFAIHVGPPDSCEAFKKSDLETA